MDTQIGTRLQIGAPEIHQAYILASLNWLQQTRSLEMNHVAIEKAEKVTMSHTACKSTDLFIAAPVDDMQQLVSFTETEIRVIPRSIDPFVFQVTPIGVVIYSKWGEEASDAIFDNVKPL